MRFQTLFEGRHFLLPSLLGMLSFWWLAGDVDAFWIWVGPAMVCTLVFIFCVNFFRDPERRIPAGEDLVVAPADGLVDAIEVVEEAEWLKGPALRVSIFLNVFSVHVNRAPISGRITYLQHHPGTYLDARHPYCHQKNEALTWGFSGRSGTLVVRQITGAIARRIVPWNLQDDWVEKGRRFGMIRFGSRTDLYLPLHAEVLVKIGDAVVGASSVIARMSLYDPGYLCPVAQILIF
jgi:phosphatidylserine decarboxylase